MSGRTKDGTTSSAITRLTVDGATQLGIASAKYAHLTGLAAEHLNGDLYRTPAASASQVWELLTANAPWPEVALLLAQRSHLGALGIWDYLITSAPTLLDGIRDASAYLGVVADTGTETIEVVESGQQVIISHVNLADTSYEVACALRAYALGLYQRRLSEAARRSLVPVRVSLAAETPRRHDPLVELYGTRSIDFEAPVSSITFLATDLRSPAPYTQPGLSAVLRRQAEHTLAAAIPLHSWLDTFQAVVRAALADGDLTLASVARRVGLSPRTLQRRLDEHGTNWRDQVETIRREHITHLLQNTDLSIESIAAGTGYADARALRRAVQRWYGDTPGALRQTLIAQRRRSRGQDSIGSNPTADRECTHPGGCFH
ncbi:AraC family transcriptional regulator [Streptomyces kaniharaensis]|uniref:AraC family transcriptional regulator n=1 Tax=Streptomyces kaniharaensis TaxID=212423 RepID=A0A6N7KXC7_9ACTN|nr:AraC family transcriptional regulator [Streptomyces kaniharaensis]MQS16190.1 AraC family transcriptional regulator [Streptomyces kaniharaensis]